MNFDPVNIVDQNDSEKLFTDGHVEEEKMAQAQSIVDTVNAVVHNQLRIQFSQFKMRTAVPLVLQGSVADGTKVFAPDEFDYMIPMDLSVDHWAIVSAYDFHSIVNRNLSGNNDCKECLANMSESDSSNAEKFLSLGVENIAFVKNVDENGSEKRRVEDESRIKDWREIIIKPCSENVERNQLCRHLQVSADLCDNFCIEHEISAFNVFHGFTESFGGLKKYVSESNRFIISSVETLRGPAITLKVAYALDRYPSATSSIIYIDYVPAVCIGGRYFVPKGRSSKSSAPMYWRESFSYKELALMTEIQSKAPTLFGMYRSVKAFHSAVNRIVAKYFEKEGLLSQNEIGLPKPKYTSSIDSLTELFARLLSGTDRFEWYLSFGRYNYISKLSSYHLKTVLFHMWKHEELRAADKGTLALVYFSFLENFILKGFIQNYFNENDFVDISNFF